MSYCYMVNMKNIIKNDNEKRLENSNKENKKINSCNCRSKSEYANCREDEVIFEEKLKINNDNKIYIGLSANQIDN